MSGIGKDRKQGADMRDWARRLAAAAEIFGEGP
jgi:hypothetical protein